MRGLALKYEVIVEVKGREQGHHIMFHFDAKDPDKARAKGEKKGRVVSVCKVDPSVVCRDVEKMKLKQQRREDRGLYIGGGLYDNTLNLDEMLGLRRAQRLEVNKRKDKL